MKNLYFQATFLELLSFYHALTTKKSLRVYWQIMLSYYNSSLRQDPLTSHKAKEKSDFSGIFNLLPTQTTLSIPPPLPSPSSSSVLTSKQLSEWQPSRGKLIRLESRVATNCFRKWSRLDSVSRHMRERGGKRELAMESNT